MDAANLRTPDEARKLWCATSNQMCRADECGHFVWAKEIRETCRKEDDGAELEIMSYVSGIDWYTKKLPRVGYCGLVHA